MDSVHRKYTKARRIIGYKLVRVTKAGNYVSLIAKKKKTYNAAGDVTKEVSYSYKPGVKYLAERAVAGVSYSLDYTAGFHVYSHFDRAATIKRRSYGRSEKAVVVQVSGMATCWGVEGGSKIYLCKDLTFGKIVGR